MNKYIYHGGKSAEEGLATVSVANWMNGQQSGSSTMDIPNVASANIGMIRQRTRMMEIVRRSARPAAGP